MNPEDAGTNPDDFDHDLVDYQIYREHIPLDGAAVKYIPYRKDSLYGFVEKYTKKFVVKPRFTQVYAVYPEGAIVEYNEFYGLTGYNDSFKIQPAFQNLVKEGNIYHGLFNGTENINTPRQHSYVGNYYFDENGRYLFDCKSERQQSFGEKDSFAWFRYRNVYKVYNRRGKLVKTFNKEKDNRFVGIFNNILVFDKTDSNNPLPHLYTGYDINGKTVFALRPRTELNATGLIQLNDTLFCAMDGSSEVLVFFNSNGIEQPYAVSDGTVGFGFRYLFPYFSQKKLIIVRNADETRPAMMISTSGKILDLHGMQPAGEEYNGEFAFADTAKKAIGFMDETGVITVPAKLELANVYREGFADRRFMYRDGLCLGHITKEYHTAEEARKAYELAEAMDMAHDDDFERYRFVYYNRDGDIAIQLPDSIVLADHFSGGLAAVVSGRTKKLGFIDKTGKLVIPYLYEAAVAGAYPMPYIIMPEFKNGFAYIKAFKGYIDDKGNQYFSGKRLQDHYSFSH